MKPTAPSALTVAGKIPWTLVMPASREPDEKEKARYADTGAGQGPGMQVTDGAVSRFRFENVCVPEHPLKLYPTEIEVTFSSADTVKLIGVPWDVIPLHWPS